MIALTLNELRRFSYRRTVRWIVVIGLLILTVVGIGIFATSDSEGLSSDARDQELERVVRDCVRFTPPGAVPPGESVEQFCRVSNAGGFSYLEDPRFCPNDLLANLGCGGLGDAPAVTFRDVGDLRGRHEPVRDSFVEVQPAPGADVSTQAQGPVLGVEPDRAFSQGALSTLGAFALMVTICLASTFIGGEYRAGTVESALVVEPRRGRLLAARWLAGCVGCATVSLLLVGWFLVVLVPTLMMKSAPHVTGLWREVGWMTARIALVSALVALVAMAVTTIGKNTVAGVGALLGYAIVSQLLVGIVLKGLQPFELLRNLTTVMGDADVEKVVVSRGQDYLVAAHGPGTALAIQVAYTVVIAAVAAAVFARRDVD